MSLGVKLHIYILPNHPLYTVCNTVKRKSVGALLTLSSQLLKWGTVSGYRENLIKLCHDGNIMHRMLEDEELRGCQISN